MPTDYLVFRWIGGMGARVSLYGQGRGNTPTQAVKDAIKSEGDQSKFGNIEEVNNSDVNGFMAVPVSNVHHFTARMK